jgi:imidazolonepropionase-like amidohydrolase
MESGGGSMLFNRMDNSYLQAIVQQAHTDGLPAAVHTGDARDVADAVAAGADSIEHGSFRDAISDAVFAQMVKQKTAYDPTLSVGEAYGDLASRNSKLLDRSLVQQVGPKELLDNTKAFLSSGDSNPMLQRMKNFPFDMKVGTDNFKHAYQHGVMLVTGSDAGNPLVIHGPTVQREVELWVEAGIPATVALQAATYNSARLLHAENHIGLIQTGNDADLLLLDGNPLEDINAIERISIVFFKGEHLDRSGLFDQQ